MQLIEKLLKVHGSRPLFCARNVAGHDQDIIVWLTGKAACSIPL